MTKVTKRSLLTSALALVVCVSMLIGTTYAWFTDSVTSNNNIITAGNLDIGVYYATPADVVNGDIPAENWKPVTSAPIFNVNALWEPGYTEAIFFKFANEGSLALQYQFKIDIVNEILGKNKDGQDFQLSKYINAYACNNFSWNYKQFLFTDREDAIDPAGAPNPYYDTLYNAANGDLATPSGDNPLSLDSWQWLDPTETTYATLVLWLPEEIGNEINHDGENVPKINLGVTVLATQYTYESDSFGNDYDINTPWSGLVDTSWYNTNNTEFVLNNGEELAGFAKLVNNGNNFSGKTIKLGANIDLANKTWTPVGVASNKPFSGIFDGQGYTISNFHLSTSSGNYGAGFFGNLVGNPTIKNVNFDSVSYSTRSNVVGVVAGYLYGSGTFENVNVTNIDVQSFGKVGGILGMAADPGAHTITMKNCSVQGVIGGGYNVGGLIGLVLQGQTVNLTNCDTDVAFYMNDSGYNMAYAKTDAGWMWVYNGQWYYAGVAEQYCYYDANQNEFCMGEPVEMYFVANTAAQLQAVAQNGGTVVLANDIEGDVTITQKAGVVLTIEGNGKNYSGVITVDGKSATYTTAGLNIKNVNFVADSISADACIRLGDGTNATRYTCNVTVENCTFDVPGAVGVKSYTGGDKNLTIIDCVATEKAHSLLQAKGIDGITVKGCEVYSKNGLNFNNSTNVTVENCTVDVKGYAVRFGEGSAADANAETYLIKDCTLKSACAESGDAVIVLRGTAANATLTIENTTITGTPDIINNTNATVIK